jgi:hypothetical protein
MLRKLRSRCWSSERAAMLKNRRMRRYSAIIPPHRAIMQLDDVRRMPGNCDIMRHKYYGRAALIETHQQLQDFFAVARIEIAGRFIGKDERRFFSHCPSDGNPLLFTTGELARAMREAVFQTDGCGSFKHKVLDGTVRNGSVLKRKSDIFLNGKMREEIEILKHKADALAADVGKTGVVEGGGIFSFKETGTGCGTFKTTEDSEQGGFPGTGWTHDGEEFPQRYRKIDVNQSGNRCCANAENFADPLCRNNRRH